MTHATWRTGERTLKLEIWDGDLLDLYGEWVICHVNRLREMGEKIASIQEKYERLEKAAWAALEPEAQSFEIKQVNALLNLWKCLKELEEDRWTTPKDS